VTANSGLTLLRLLSAPSIDIIVVTHGPLLCVRRRGPLVCPYQSFKFVQRTNFTFFMQLGIDFMYM